MFLDRLCPIYNMINVIKNAHSWFTKLKHTKDDTRLDQQPKTPKDVQFRFELLIDN